MIWVGIATVIGVLAVAIAFIFAALRVSSRLTEMAARMDGMEQAANVPPPNSVATSITGSVATQGFVTHTPMTIVDEWASEQETMGLVVDPQTIKDQVEMWKQNEEYL